MPLLTFQDAQGAAHSVQIAEAEDVRLGTDADWSNVILPAGMGVIPRHAILSRSSMNRLLMLLDLSGDQTWVNQHPVVKIRVLRQGDRVVMGRCALNVWEVQVRTLQPSDPAVGQKCPVSRRVLNVGDEVIACPGCGTVHERDAWFLIERCAAGCGYPNRAVIMDTLPAWLVIERHMDQESKTDRESRERAGAPGGRNLPGRAGARSGAVPGGTKRAVLPVVPIAISPGMFPDAARLPGVPV